MISENRIGHCIVMVLGIVLMLSTFTFCSLSMQLSKDLGVAETNLFLSGVQISQLERDIKEYTNKVELLESLPPGSGIQLKAVTRGLRNKNPMNIASLGSGNQWLGQVGQDELGLAIFATYEHGLRAGYLTLIAYQQKHRRNTLLEIFQRYCTGDYRRYAAFVADQLHIGIDDIIDVRSCMPALMQAVIQYENGYQPFPAEYFIPYAR